MAPRNERELQTDINAAIAGTEDEIFRDAMEAAFDDNDGDNSLEAMGEGLEGDHLDEEIEIEDPDEPADDEGEDADDEGDEEDEDADAEDEDGEGDEDGEDEEEEADATPPQRGNREQPNIPPSRLRKATERTRLIEQERDQYRTQVTTLEARFNDLLQRVNTGQVGPAADKTVKQEAPVKPDMFTDPDGYEAWVLQQAEERATARVTSALADRDRQAQEQVNQRVDHSFQEAASGPRGFEFMPAYNALKSLDPKDPQAQRLVRGIFNSQDPQAALFEWWDENGGQDFRENIARQLGFIQDEPRRQRRDDGGRQQQRQQPQRQQVRHEIRPAQRLRSLNGASGGNGSNRVSDPEMLDNSEDSVFRYATR